MPLRVKQIVSSAVAFNPAAFDGSQRHDYWRD
jgi:hypothetical protein